MKDSWWRYAQIYYVVDGDTVDAVIDMGFRRRSDERLRLLGVNTPELHALDPVLRVKAVQARQFVIDWLSEHGACNTVASSWGGVEVNPFEIQSAKSDVFGRWLAMVECQAGHNLTQDLLTAGLGVVWTR